MVKLNGQSLFTVKSYGCVDIGRKRNHGMLGEEREECSAPLVLEIRAAFNYPSGSLFYHGGTGRISESIRHSYSEFKKYVVSVLTDLSQPESQKHHLSVKNRPLTVLAAASAYFSVFGIYDNERNLNGTLHLKKLKRLDLYNNDLQQVPSLYKQTLVEAQNLSSSQLEGVHLEELDLSHNSLVNDELNGAKSLEGLCGLRNLEVLDISFNEFSGPLPSCFFNLTSLRKLDVYDNHFSGAIPLSVLSNLKSLEFIDFSRNAFEGSLSLASMANNSNLEVFRLLDNHNHLEVNTEEPTWFPSFQLKEFSLSNCPLNKDTNGVIPSFLKEQHDLRVVEISHSGMTGNFPNWLLVKNLYLREFQLRGNNLSGAFALPSNLSLDGMRLFDVSANFIGGASILDWFYPPGFAFSELVNQLIER
ncbi:receptor-like protein 9a [Eucalyptus grandis]|uniref:receptor-like protein 9a n=1 Tax=Eucalyptus grandis TaxID=71139 RepID=UPI00192ED60B|nr:receptor-like protein 9a [Eucalyptus grandis]